MKAKILILLLAVSISAMAGMKIDRNAPYLKPGAAVYIASPDFIQLEPNSQQRVVIQIATAGKGTLHLTPKPSAGITVSENEEASYSLTNDNRLEIAFTVSTQEAGEHRLMLHARLDDGDAERFRVFGVVVYVGEQASTFSQKTYPEHIVLPAQETIRWNLLTKATQ